jgi:methylenetetrahydrofolate dehydrogenase (NADP+)/methenyltetrahydrofolate cyclohydrolase
MCEGSIEGGKQGGKEFYMSAKLLDGKIIAAKINAQLAEELRGLKSKTGKVPHLASLEIGSSDASAVYIKLQTSAAAKLGIEYKNHKLGPATTQTEAENTVKKLNKDPGVTGIILQLPHPKGIDAKRLQAMIEITKDVEAVNPANLGRVFAGGYRIAPCTAAAVMELIASTGIDLDGKEAVVVGRSSIVGKPVAMLLMEKNATVTICHTGTNRSGLLPGHVKSADILVVAAGRPGLVKGEWIKKGAIVIDVGTTVVNDKIVGDVEFDEATKRAAYITPVPGGLGPLTVAILMRNTIELFKAL